MNALLNNTKKTHEALVTDLIPEQLSESQLHLILQMLLSERVCVRDMVSILEALSYHSRVNKEPDYLHEQTRMALSRAICKQHADDDSGELPALTISPELEDQMAQALTEDGKKPGPWPRPHPATLPIPQPRGRASHYPNGSPASRALQF